MKHPISPPSATSLEELGTQIAALRYDAQIVVFNAYIAELLRQAGEDKKKHRYRLVAEGLRVAQAQRFSEEALAEMLRISVRYMQKDIEEQPLLVRLP